MNKIIITTFLLTQLIVSSCAQTEEEKNEQYKKKATAVAKAFTEAIYHGDYEKAQSLAFDYNAVKYVDYYLLENVQYEIKRECIEKKRCAPLDPEWTFQLLKIGDGHIPTKDGGHMLRYKFRYTCKEGYYNVLTVSEYVSKSASQLEDDKNFKVSSASLDFDLLCFRLISKLKNQQDDE